MANSPLELLVREKSGKSLTADEASRLVTFKQTDSYKIFQANNGLKQKTSETEAATKDLLVANTKLELFSRLLQPLVVMMPLLDKDSNYLANVIDVVTGSDLSKVSKSFSSQEASNIKSIKTLVLTGNYVSTIISMNLSHGPFSSVPTGFSDSLVKSVQTIAVMFPEASDKYDVTSTLEKIHPSPTVENNNNTNNLMAIFRKADTKTISQIISSREALKTRLTQVIGEWRNTVSSMSLEQQAVMQPILNAPTLDIGIAKFNELTPEQKALLIDPYSSGS